MIALTKPQIVTLERLQQLGQRMKVRLFLVGGVVRDLLLLERLDDKDFDLVVEGSSAACAKELSREFGGKMVEFKDFLTAKVSGLDPSFAASEIDFATARTEKYLSPGSLPKVEAAGIDEDLKRRDFTINAMALPLELFCEVVRGGASKDKLIECLIDKFDGLGDLQAGRVKVLHSASMIDDPTRAFRACRYAARIGGQVEDQTLELIKQMIASGGLKTISDFRKVTELKKIFAESSWAAAVELMAGLNFFPAMDFCSPDQNSEFAHALQRMALFPSIDGSARVRLCHWLACYFLGKRGEVRLHELGFAKKKASSVALHVEEVRAARSESFSAEAAQLALLIEKDHARLSKIRDFLKV